MLKHLKEHTKVCKTCQELILFLIGGIVYYTIEVLFRGYSHWSMFIVGGICFLFIGILNNKFTYEMSVISQMWLSAIFITLLELISGIILNIIFELEVWNYSEQPYNFLGQICLLFHVIWFYLSIVGILLDDWIRYWLFDEEKPKYKIL